jgi:hypothetical protein
MRASVAGCRLIRFRGNEKKLVTSAGFSAIRDWQPLIAPFGTLVGPGWRPGGVCRIMRLIRKGASPDMQREIDLKRLLPETPVIESQRIFGVRGISLRGSNKIMQTVLTVREELGLRNRIRRLS